MLPAKNLYRMLCYAWNHAPDAVSEKELEASEFENIADLMGRMLASALAALIRRGLDRAYIVEEEQTSMPRGRIDVRVTMTRFLEQRGMVHCVRDELSADVAHNRLLKATALRLARAVESRKVAASLVRLAERMVGVSDVEPSLEVLRRIQLHRNVMHYAYPLSLCELVLRQLVPEPEKGGWRFNDFTASPSEMGWLFEDFVRGFLGREALGVRVLRKERLRWALVAKDDEAKALLPTMEQDVPLEVGGRRMLIETKCVQRPFRSGRDGRLRLQEGHLYQLHAYLTNAEQAGRPYEAGVLLYGTLGRSFHYEYRADDVPIHVVGLDLERSWSEVHDELVQLPHNALPRQREITPTISETRVERERTKEKVPMLVA